MVCRRYGTTIRQTVFEVFKEILNNWQLTQYVKINEGDFRIRFPNGSEIFFTGLDSEEKLLSLANVSCIFIEEAYEVPKDIFEQLDLRMRGHMANQQIIMAWNPISSQSWLYDFVNSPPESFVFIHSTYKDNPFLNKEYVASIEALQTRNPQKWRIYGLGEWGIDTDGLVLTNWKDEVLDETDLAKKYEHRAGIDWGWNDPSAIVDTYYDKSNRTIYIVNEFYKTGQRIEDLKKALRDMHLTKVKVQADSAEPRTIDAFRKDGYYVVPCVKGANSVDTRIAFLQDHLIIVDPRCKNVIMELSNFSYEKDKKTGKYTDDKYTHEFSHSIDALSYAYSDIYTKGRLRSINKGVLGLA
jgi:phage terminase large subunit